MVRNAWNWLLSRFYRRLADAHRHMGNAYSNRLEYQAALNNYTRALHRDPNYTYVYYSRGVLCWREFGNPQQAIEDLTKVLDLDPSWPEAYFNRALAYKLHGDYGKAIADFERYLQEGTDDFWLEATHIQLAEIRDQMGEGEHL